MFYYTPHKNIIQAYFRKNSILWIVSDRRRNAVFFSYQNTEQKEIPVKPALGGYTRIFAIITAKHKSYHAAGLCQAL